ncbi:hypothetical protein [Flaviaesturariibacter aridisoli]|uniref:Lipoprotein n=1 Tax=Flaviaesturariibacter aridisoli TaxID=2545761 RepID=A0A4R4E4J9_9BACT|nr:hypothetical protein [Flaviaesturariibacter aridisoli]TCZ73640.1 hypothetical protein E0486_04985 [Flaviaesturariibacter aridisoli]
MRYLLFILLCPLLLACQKTERTVQRSFYYWKTVYNPTAREKAALDSLRINNLYVRLFDVGIDEATGAVEPRGKISWKQSPTGRTITPVVFITQEALRSGDSTSLDSLAARTARLSETLTRGVRLSREWQIDCDWSAATRDRYFHFLRRLRAQPFARGKTLSVTVRLHQLKYAASAGIPPADRGLLMAYNMGNLRDPGATNSILDNEELDKYIASADRYPLPLDAALPLFDWYVWFSANHYQGLVHHLESPALQGPGRFPFATDTMIEGYAFRRGDWLRHETSPAEALADAAGTLSRHLPSADVRVLLFDLDEHNLAGYQLHELETVFERFRRGAARPRAAKRH